MNITLINPQSIEKYNTTVMHLSILYLATALNKEGHKVKVIDAQIDNVNKKVDALIHKTDFFGLSVLTTQVKHSLEISDYIKSIDREVPIIWGGVHCTLFPYQTISDDAVDYAVRGEGENTLIEFIKRYNKGRDFSKVDGLVYKQDDSIRINPERSYLDLNSLSPPNWKLLRIKEYVVDYVVGDENYGKHLPLHSGRGCTYRCAFCINTLYEKRRWRPLDASNIINEIKILKERFNLNYIKFVDENFFINKERVEEFCKGIIKEKIDVRWHALGRANYFNKNHLNNELLSLIKKSGCAIISMGLESGSPKILKVLKKDITTKQSIETIEECKRFDIRPVCSFMTGLPTETREDTLKTVELIKKIKEIHPHAYIIGPQIFRPYPGAELYDLAKKMGFHEPENLRRWADYDFTGGFVSSTYLPWVKDPGFIEAVEFYMGRFQNPDVKKWNVISTIMSYIAKYRVKNNFYDFPIDKKIFETAKRLYLEYKQDKRGEKSTYAD